MENIEGVWPILRNIQYQCESLEGRGEEEGEIEGGMLADDMMEWQGRMEGADDKMRDTKREG